ncbi:hypothetical protein FJZ26_00180 [Candidatus Parvarchaeota archaeon]|nr:hypothetical protein [Candidatus Parvarchaeota archaeon]
MAWTVVFANGKFTDDAKSLNPKYRAFLQKQLPIAQRAFSRIAKKAGAKDVSFIVTNEPELSAYFDKKGYIAKQHNEKLEGRATAASINAATIKTKKVVGLTTSVFDLHTEKEVEALLAREVGRVERDRGWPKALAVLLTNVPLLVAGFYNKVFIGSSIALCAIVDLLIPGYFSRRQAYKSDKFAAKVVGSAKPLIAAYEKQLAITDKPGFLERQVSGEPLLERRIRRLEKLEKKLEARKAKAKITVL